MLFKFILFLFFVVSLSFSNHIVFGTHETDHRFTVYGIVKDSAGIFQPNVKVMVSDILTGEGNTVFTDQNGYYEVLLHLHNNNLGDEIKITAGKEVKSIKASFNPEDRKTERKAEVDVQISRPNDAKSGYGWNIAAGILFLGGFIILLRTIYQRKMAK
ncbi:MAG: carboxypeptidase-like regulatory domain-containing protein [Nitrospiria bacterium]